MRRAPLIILTLLLAAACLAAQGSGSRPKVAVVLSGGGAKGVAHIGALKVIEEAGIPIDMIVGTSMGAVVGGLYSIGYTPHQLDSMVMAQDWGWLLSDRIHRADRTFVQKENDDRYQLIIPFGRKIEVGGLMRGTNLDMLFSDLMVGYHDTLDFNTLPIPFACVAADITTGRAEVFHRGALPTAVRASMAIPGVFTPVYLGEQVLVDGGVVDNFPTDVAREMGADVVIGVDVQSTLRPREDLVGATAVLGQIVEIAMKQQTFERNVALTDLYIKVDVDGYSVASFSLPAVDTLMDRGEAAARECFDDLVKLRTQAGLDCDPAPPPHGPYEPLNLRGDFNVYRISFEGLGERRHRWIMRSCRLRENSRMSIDRLDHCMSLLEATTSHSDIYYSLIDTLGGYNLAFHMKALKGNSVSVGLEFDSEEIASAIVGGTFRFGVRAPMEATITGRFGRRIVGSVDYSFFYTPLSSFRFNYSYTHSDLVINRGGKRYLNPTYNHHYASASFVDMSFLHQNLRMEVGTAVQKFFYQRWLTDSRYLEFTGEPIKVSNERFFSYFARIDFDNLNSRYFPRSGTAVTIDYDLYTDNFYSYRNHSPLSVFAVSWMTAIPFPRGFVLVPSIYGRILLDNDVPFPLVNMAGGKFFGRYLHQQLPFDGIGYIEAVPNAFLAAKMQLRKIFGRRHWVAASFNYAIADNNYFRKIVLDRDTRKLAFTGAHYYGASLDYGYDLRSFPLMASVGWSSVTRTPWVYLQAGYTF